VTSSLINFKFSFLTRLFKQQCIIGTGQQAV
jgi:hypothetical protein